MWGHPRTGNGDQDLVAKMMVMIMMRSFRGVSHPFNRISLCLSLSLSRGGRWECGNGVSFRSLRNRATVGTGRVEGVAFAIFHADLLQFG